MKIIVVSDRPVVADAMVMALEGRLDGVATRHVAGIAACLRVASEWHPDLAIVDLGIALAEVRRLNTELHRGGTRCLHIVAGAAEALQLLEARAAGVVTGEEGVDALVHAAEVVLKGHTHVPSALLGSVLQGLIRINREQRASSPRLDRLSVREREVLALLGDGLDQRGIARRLSISPQTAKTHIRHVMTKLGVRSRIAAAALAADLHATEGSGR